MGIPFAADGSHMKALSRTDNDVNWCLECTITAKSFSGAGSTINNMMSQKVVFSMLSAIGICCWRAQLIHILIKHIPFRFLTIDKRCK
ncbi:MAG: hypothetical protein Ta2E_11810 [Mycoplasmoidaceae bacterium]|nr:MAG: hypothetical protein Ta2E_11810 [Mycoplasmoidaceae bacterium]